VFVRWRYWLIRHFDPVVRAQIKDPLLVPIIIINFNQLFFLRQLVGFLLERGFKNVVVIDNKSTYPPLLDYYREMADRIKVEYRENNEGHPVFFRTPELQEKYGKGYFVVTDSDIVPNINLPMDFMAQMMSVLDKHYNCINKVGFALDLEDIPDSYLPKDKVLKWEKQFWEKPLGNDMYEAGIDTTFALYKPKYPRCFKNEHFIKSIRMAGPFTSQHGGWLLDSANLTDEQKYYNKHATNYSSSWKIDERGQFIGYKNY